MGLFSKRRLREYQDRDQLPKTHTIMIVDDEESNRRTLKSLLQDKYELIEACDGQDALEIISQMEDPKRISLIISDQRMPRLTGSEMFEKLVPVLPNTVRIMLTGFADKNAVLDGVNRGKVYKLLSKPFERKDFLATINRALEVYELQSQI